MTLLETPPQWRDAFEGKGNPFLRLFQDVEVMDFVNQMNDMYYYWDDLKYRPRPKHISPEMGWFFVKISRLLHKKLLALSSTHGRPFGYWLPDGVLRELHFIDQHATGQMMVDDPTIGSFDTNRYIISSLMEEAIASSILEGAATTRKKAKDMLREGRKPRTRGELMIHNNYSTMLKIKDRVEEELTVELLIEIQAAITRGTLEDATASGRLRRPDELIYVIDTTDGTILHTPPPAEDLIPRLQKLCDFANAFQEHTFFHPVIKGILLHFWLAYEHPFVDGNGRTARALFYWFLLKHKYWLVEFLPISRIILRSPAKYKMAFLYSEQDDEDLTYFINFNLRALRVSIEDFKKYLSQRRQELKAAGAFLRRFPRLNHRQQELLGDALRHPDARYTLVHHASIHGIVYQTARTDILELLALGLLARNKVGRAHYFSPVENLERKLRVPPSR